MKNIIPLVILTILSCRQANRSKVPSPSSPLTPQPISEKTQPRSDENPRFKLFEIDSTGIKKRKVANQENIELSKTIINIPPSKNFPKGSLFILAKNSVSKLPANESFQLAGAANLLWKGACMFACAAGVRASTPAAISRGAPASVGQLDFDTGNIAKLVEYDIDGAGRGYVPEVGSVARMNETELDGVEVPIENITDPSTVSTLARKGNYTTYDIGDNTTIASVILKPKFPGSFFDPIGFGKANIDLDPNLTGIRYLTEGLEDYAGNFSVLQRNMTENANLRPQRMLVVDDIKGDTGARLLTFDQYGNLAPIKGLDGKDGVEALKDVESVFQIPNSLNQYMMCTSKAKCMRFEIKEQGTTIEAVPVGERFNLPVDSSKYNNIEGSFAFQDNNGRNLMLFGSRGGGGGEFGPTTGRWLHLDEVDFDSNPPKFNNLWKVELPADDGYNWRVNADIARDPRNGQIHIVQAIDNEGFEVPGLPEFASRILVYDPSGNLLRVDVYEGNKIEGINFIDGQRHLVTDNEAGKNYYCIADDCLPIEGAFSGIAPLPRLAPNVPVTQ